MIEFRGIGKRYGESRILHDVSLRVEAGERAALIGPSGGGKTTLLRCTLGLEPFDSGEIILDDIAVKADESPARRTKALREIRRKACVVFQQFHLFPHLSVLENVLSGPVYGLGIPRDKAEPKALELLKHVGLESKVHDRPENLSGGQQQRVAIARAMAMDPKVLLLDEPTSALDPRNAREVVNVITDLAHQGQTMLLVTHDITFARRVATRFHVMDQGRVIETGSAAQVLDHPREEATRSFLGSVVRDN
jgi:ABC-type polar amino acid transport system ATPase subunit